MRGRNGGFTLLELMIAVAILGILTGVLVYNLNSPTRKIKTTQEAISMFAEFSRSQSQYALEHGVYYSTGADESAIFPTTPEENATDVSTLPDEWKTLHVQPQTAKLFCGYVTVAGTKDDDIPSIAADTFNMIQPEGNWYVIYGRCDMDHSATVDTEYFQSSVDATLIKRNEGH